MSRSMVANVPVFSSGVRSSPMTFRTPTGDLLIPNIPTPHATIQATSMMNSTLGSHSRTVSGDLIIPSTTVSPTMLPDPSMVHSFTLMTDGSGRAQVLSRNALGPVLVDVYIPPQQAVRYGQQVNAVKKVQISNDIINDEMKWLSQLNSLVSRIEAIPESPERSVVQPIQASLNALMTPLQNRVRAFRDVLSAEQAVNANPHDIRTRLSLESAQRNLNDTLQIYYSQLKKLATDLTGTIRATISSTSPMQIWYNEARDLFSYIDRESQRHDKQRGISLLTSAQIMIENKIQTDIKKLEMEQLLVSNLVNDLQQWILLLSRNPKYAVKQHDFQVVIEQLKYYLQNRVNLTRDLINLERSSSQRINDMRLQNARNEKQKQINALTGYGGLLQLSSSRFTSLLSPSEYSDNPELQSRREHIVRQFEQLQRHIVNGISPENVGREDIPTVKATPVLPMPPSSSTGRPSFPMIVETVMTGLKEPPAYTPPPMTIAVGGGIEPPAAIPIPAGAPAPPLSPPIPVMTPVMVPVATPTGTTSIPTVPVVTTETPTMTPIVVPVVTPSIPIAPPLETPAVAIPTVVTQTVAIPTGGTPTGGTPIPAVPVVPTTPGMNIPIAPPLTSVPVVSDIPVAPPLTPSSGSVTTSPATPLVESNIPPPPGEIGGSGIPVPPPFDDVSGIPPPPPGVPEISSTAIPEAPPIGDLGGVNIPPPPGPPNDGGGIPAPPPFGEPSMIPPPSAFIIPAKKPTSTPAKSAAIVGPCGPKPTDFLKEIAWRKCVKDNQPGGANPTDIKRPTTGGAAASSTGAKSTETKTPLSFEAAAKARLEARRNALREDEDDNKSTDEDWDTDDYGKSQQAVVKRVLERFISAIPGSTQLNDVTRTSILTSADKEQKRSDAWLQPLTPEQRASASNIKCDAGLIKDTKSGFCISTGDKGIEERKALALWRGEAP